MRLLIADDEDYTREGLVEGINWNEYGIDEIMQARDGSVALKIAKWFIPDIILTDIRMPKMDGIEFAKELLLINSDSILIFMSGYMEVNYLKSAIELSAVAFIEKPISIQKVTDAVSKAIEEVVKHKKHKKLSVDNVELQRQRLVNILICKDNSREMVLRLCNEIGFTNANNYNCMVIWDKETLGNRDTNIRIINTWFENHAISCLCNNKELNHYIVILSYHNKVQKDMERFYCDFSKENPQFTIGIGFPVSDIMNIYTSYSSATTAFNYSYYDEVNKLFEIDEHVLRQPVLDPGIYNEFLNIYKNTPYQLEEWFDHLIDHLIEMKYYQKDQVNILLKSFLVTILREHVDLYEDLDGISSNEEINIAFEFAKSICDINKILKDVTKVLLQKLDNTSQYSKVVNDAIDYILKHYQDSNLSIQEIADYMRLSSTHLNVLFKQEKRITLKQYLSDIRNKKAMVLLENEHYNVMEVAEMCGYTNANYFAKVFKESNKLTPMEYRKQRRT